jgi:hypothetical protein
VSNTELDTYIVGNDFFGYRVKHHSTHIMVVIIYPLLESKHFLVLYVYICRVFFVKIHEFLGYVHIINLFLHKIIKIQISYQD